MAEIGTTESGLYYVKMDVAEAAKCGFGYKPGRCICMYCNNIADPVYYIPVLNDTLCEICFNSWKTRAKRYKEDVAFENNKLTQVKTQLGIIV